MKKNFLYLFTILLFSTSSFGQLMTTKVIGKNAKEFKTGVGVFANLEMPLNQSFNRSVVLEICDCGIFSGKSNLDTSAAFVSVKIGYKKIFSNTQTGFYINPSVGVGWAFMAKNVVDTLSKRFGPAMAIEAGYSLEVGKRGNAICLGLKCESDVPFSTYNLTTLQLRIAYSFHNRKRVTTPKK